MTRLFRDFFSSEQAGGAILVIVTALSLFLANSAFGPDYSALWDFHVGGHSITHWINDGLMAIFFLLIGLELKRETYQGELADIKNASLPIFGALGGMLVPAALFLAFNYGTKTQSGAGIPMATDIAFAVGILSLLGKRIPNSLKVFLTALAVIDDLGAIIVIAAFYTTSISFFHLLVALGIFALLLLLNRMKVNNLIPYLIGGVVMWYFMLHSGIHATITGVLLAFAVPYGNGGRKTPSYILQHLLHRPVAFYILPLFAMANTCILLDGGLENLLKDANSLGILCGLIIGKPLGIFAFCYTATQLGWCALPSDLKWTNIIGVSCLAGIGFTMSIFITLLAFSDEAIINESKIAILVASAAAGIIGYIFLFTVSRSDRRKKHFPK